MLAMTLVASEKLRSLLECSELAGEQQVLDAESFPLVLVGLPVWATEPVMGLLDMMDLGIQKQPKSVTSGVIVRTRTSLQAIV